MRGASASIDITPPIGLPIGGNIREDDISRGIHDRLYCNAIVIEDEGELVCFLSFDLGGLRYETCNLIKEQIKEKSGLKAENILISATHTHSGPDILGLFKDGINSKCMDYIRDITEKVSDRVAGLLHELEEVNVFISRREVCGLSFNRRLVMKAGKMRMNWEDVDIDDVLKEAGPIDPELLVTSLRDSEGNVKALMVNFTLHPAVLVGKDWLYSRDYLNYLDEYVKDKLGSDTVVFFANGAEGNVNHINFRDKSQGRGFEEAERIGNALGEEVLKSLEESQAVKDKSLKCVHQTIRLPLRRIPREDIEKAKQLLQKRGDKIPSLLDGIPDEIYAREIIKLGGLNDTHVETTIHAVKLGDNVIVTIPGEIFVEFGLKIKETSGYNNTLVFGLTNDCIGYIPTQQSFSEGGYEIKTASSSKLDEMAGDMLVIEIKQLLKKL